MDAGKLDRRVTILRSLVQDDGLQATLSAPLPIGTIWASKVDVSDAERQRSGIIGAEITARFQVRSSEFSRCILPSDLLHCGGVDYDITGIKEIGRRNGLEITTKAKVG